MGKLPYFLKTLSRWVYEPRRALQIILNKKTSPYRSTQLSILQYTHRIETLFPPLMVCNYKLKDLIKSRAITALNLYCAPGRAIAWNRNKTTAIFSITKFSHWFLFSNSVHFLCKSTIILKYTQLHYFVPLEKNYWFREVDQVKLSNFIKGSVRKPFINLSNQYLWSAVLL